MLTRSSQCKKIHNKSLSNLQQNEQLYNKSTTFLKILYRLFYYKSTANPQLIEQVEFGL